MTTEIIKRNELEKRIENLEEVVDTLCTQVGALTTAVDIAPTENVRVRRNGVHKIGERSYIDYGDK